MERIGRYEIELVLGEGTVGRVLLARDPVLGRRVALKVLRDDLELTPEHRAQLADRICREARATAALSHPFSVTLHDMGEDASAGPYLVFEFIQGSTLRERLATGPIPPGDVAQMARAIGASLAHAHAAGVVHRDIKPGSILLSPTGPRLTGPGFASLARTDATLRQAMPALQETFAPAYAAPESLASDRYSPHSDQFSLAATLYEALTGKRAFGEGDAPSVAARVAASAYEAPSMALPRLRSFPNLDTIFRRAFAQDPRKRFSSSDVFGNVLATEIEGADASRLAPGSVSSIVPRATRRWQNAIATAAALVIVALVVVGRQRQRPSEGVSLKNAASAFAVAIAPPHGPAVHGAHATLPPSTLPARAAEPAASARDPLAPVPDAASERPLAPFGDAF